MTVIAWLWARTVRSPDPSAKGAMVPLVSSFMLSTKESKKAWVEPVIDANALDGWRFEVKTGALTKAEEKKLTEGTKSARATFRCVLTGANIGGAYADDEAQAGRMSTRLMAIVAEGNRSRTYLSPTKQHEQSFDAASKLVAAQGDEMDLPRQECRGTFASNAQGRRYCLVSRPVGFHRQPLAEPDVRTLASSGSHQARRLSLPYCQCAKSSARSRLNRSRTSHVWALCPLKRLNFRIIQACSVWSTYWKILSSAEGVYRP